MLLDTLSSIGLVTRIEQLEEVLLAFCLLIGVRRAVLSTRDRLVSDLTLGFIDHRRLMVVTDLAHARWLSLARLQHARIAHILSSKIAWLALAYSVLLRIMEASIMLLVQAVLMILLSLFVALLTTVFALAGLAVLVPLSSRASEVGKSSPRFPFRIAGDVEQIGTELRAAHDTAARHQQRIGGELPD